MIQNLPEIMVWQMIFIGIALVLLVWALVICWQNWSDVPPPEVVVSENEPVTEHTAPTNPQAVVCQSNLDKISQQTAKKYRPVLVGTMEPVAQETNSAALMRTAKVTFKTTMKAITKTVRMGPAPQRRSPSA